MARADLQIAHPLQIRSEPLFVEGMLREFAAAFDPEQKEVRRPMVGIGLRSPVTQVDTAIQDRIARLHRDGGEGFSSEILDARTFAIDADGADFERPWHIVAISERERHAVFA